MPRDPYSELTREVLDYQRDPESRKDLIEKIAKIVYAYPANSQGWEEDDVGDFFCQFYPKIQGILDRFVFNGRPFEAYLTASIKWQMKSFAGRRTTEYAGYEVVRTESKRDYTDSVTHQTMVREPEYTYDPKVAKVLGIGVDGKIEDPAIGKRLAFLVLRNAAMVNDSIIEHAAKLAGLNPNFLLGCATELRQKMQKRKARYLNMSRRRDALYARIQHLTVLLSRETEEESKAVLRRQIEFARKRYWINVNGLKSAQLLPTHKEIGEVMGIPKGSVDSGLYYIRRDIEEIGLN